MTCVKCGFDWLDGSSCGGMAETECALRAEVRDLKAERNAMEMRRDATLDELRNLQAAVMRVIEPMSKRMKGYRGSVGGDQIIMWMRELQAELDRKQRVEHPVCLCGDTITPGTINADNCLLTPDGWVCGVCNSATQKGATNVPL